MAQKLAKGCIVTIFQKPIQEKEPEGTATLIEKVKSRLLKGRYLVETWQVIFVSEHRIFTRRILAHVEQNESYKPSYQKAKRLALQY